MFTIENRKSYNKRKCLKKTIQELKINLENATRWYNDYYNENCKLKDGIYPRYEEELKNKKNEITNLQGRIKNLNDVIKGEGIPIGKKSDEQQATIIQQGKIIDERNQTIKALREEIERLTPKIKCECFNECVCIAGAI